MGHRFWSSPDVYWPVKYLFQQIDAARYDEEGEERRGEVRRRERERGEERVNIDLTN